MTRLEYLAHLVLFIGPACRYRTQKVSSNLHFVQVAVVALFDSAGRVTV